MPTLLNLQQYLAPIFISRKGSNNIIKFLQMKYLIRRQRKYIQIDSNTSRWNFIRFQQLLRTFVVGYASLGILMILMFEAGNAITFDFL